MQEKTEESTHSSSVPTLSTSIPGDSVTMSSHLHQSSNWPHQCKYKKKKKKNLHDALPTAKVPGNHLSQNINTGILSIINTVHSENI